MNEDLKYILLNGGMGFISSLIRVLHNFHKSGKRDWKKSVTRVMIGSVLSYFAGLRLPEDLVAYGVDIKGPAIFLVGFFGVELIDFIENKDINFLISLITKNGDKTRPNK